MEDQSGRIGERPSEMQIIANSAINQLDDAQFQFPSDLNIVPSQTQLIPTSGAPKRTFDRITEVGFQGGFRSIRPSHAQHMIEDTSIPAAPSKPKRYQVVYAI